MPSSPLRPVLAVGRGIWASVLMTAMALHGMTGRYGVVNPVVREHSARQLVFSGAHAVPLVLFLGVLTGGSLLTSLGIFFPGAQNQSAVTRAAVHILSREAAPIIAALVLIVRSCPAIVVELGYMRTRGEIDAMSALGVDPVRLVVVPRFVGLVGGAFGLTAMFLAAAQAGGIAAAVLVGIETDPRAAAWSFLAHLDVTDLLSAGIKAIAFGLVLASLSCRAGLSVPRDLTRIPPAVTRTLVAALVSCVLLSALLSYVLP
ncbi:MAG: ABC transporter permease [Deltaproteobacteria bacterium]|nr:MAG: ABC transporter permease [Deltaproteobacteria bacterium]